eukprot:3820735-Pyramimonas_sp.AAC.1
MKGTPPSHSRRIGETFNCKWGTVRSSGRRAMLSCTTVIVIDDSDDGYIASDKSACPKENVDPWDIPDPGKVVTPPKPKPPGWIPNQGR